MPGRRLRLGIGLALCVALLTAIPGSALGARVNYRAVSDSPETKFFDQGGLQLRGECQSGAELLVSARSTVDDALIHYNLQNLEPSFASGFDNDFDAGVSDEEDLQAFLAAGGFGLDSAVGQIVYAKPGGTNVTVDFMVEEEGEGGLLGSGKNCVFTGHARVLSTGDADRVNFRTSADPAGEQTFFSRGGLQLVEDDEGNCSGGDQNTRARTTVADAMFGNFDQYTDDEDATDAVDASIEPNFDMGEANERVLFDDNNSANHLVYARSGGKNVTVDWAAEEDGSGLFGGTKSCAFVGSARVAESGSPHRVNFRTDGEEDLTTFFQYGGLRLRGSCEPGSELEVEAKTSYDDAIIHVNYQEPATGHHFDESDGFDIGDVRPIFGDASVIGGNAEAGGQILYSRPGGVNVTVDWMAEEDGFPLGGTKACAFVGTAEKNAP
jgi:hypothetical protein